MIWIIIFLGFILRVISLNQSLWLDEAINTLAVKNYSLFNLVTQYARADFHPPGWFITLWFWTRAFGYSEIAVRAPSVIFGLLTIWIIYLIGEKLVSNRVGLLAALLLAVNPLHIYYSQEARMYSMATLAVALNIWLLIRDKKTNIIFLVLSNIFILASDYVAYFIFPAQFIFLWLYKKQLLKKWFTGIFLALLLGIWWLPTFLGQLNVGIVVSVNLPTWKFVNGAFDFKTLPLTFVKFIIGRISLDNKILYTVLLIPIFSLFGYLIFKGIKFSRNLLLIWLIVPALIATTISFFIPVYNYFRVLYILPPFILLLAEGISISRKYFLILVLLIELFCSFVYLFNPLFHREDWKGLVNFFKEEKPSIILFESSGTFLPFDYYAENYVNGAGALKNFPAKDLSDIKDLKAELGNKNDAYLVDYLVEISDPFRLVKKSLLSLGYKQVRVYNFTGVGFVYYFRKDQYAN